MTSLQDRVLACWATCTLANNFGLGNKEIDRLHMAFLSSCIEFTLIHPNTHANDSLTQGTNILSIFTMAHFRVHGSPDNGPKITAKETRLGLNKGRLPQF